MAQRINYSEHAPDTVKNLIAIRTSLHNGSLEPRLIHLVDIRASQLNECTFCIDMHVKEAILDNETQLRLHHLAGWKESPLFSDRERAALSWTEALTKLSPESTRDDIYETVRQHFTEQELVELTMAITLINSWNRLGVGFRSVPGSLDKLYGLDKALV